MAGPAARVAPAWAAGPRGAQAPASSSAGGRAASSGRGLRKGLHQPPALPAPAPACETRPAAPQARQGVGARMPPTAPARHRAQRRPELPPRGPPAQGRRRACVPHLPRAACGPLRRAHQPRTLAFIFTSPVSPPAAPVTPLKQRVRSQSPQETNPAAASFSTGPSARSHLGGLPRASEKPPAQDNLAVEML